MTDLTVSLRLLLQSRELTRGLQGGTREINRFGRDGQAAMSRLDSTIKGVRNRLAALGVGLAAGQALRDSARLDKSITQIGQTAGAARSEVAGLRGEIFRMARDTGRPIDTLLGGFNNLIQAGLDFRAALAATRAINPASAVTGAGEDVLAGGLTVAARAFQFDLSQPRLALELLDQMTVAGRLGNAELEDLANIFARVGVNAKAANLSFPDTLAFVEGLSQVERNPERLSTLADSTLRLFNNLKYQEGASKATGVNFYNGDKSSREPLAVLGDIADKYRALATDKARDLFIAKAFGETDLDTQKGLRTLLGGDALKQIGDFVTQIRGASGTVARDLPGALDNAEDQSRRLAANFKTIGDAFAKPINRALADLIEFQLDSPDKGGLGLSSGGSALTTAGLALVTGVIAKSVSSLLSKIPFIGGAAGSAAGLAGGVVQGKALEQLAGVQPVFVTNFPDAGGSGGLAETAAAAAGVAAVARSGLLARLGLTTAAGVGTAALGTAGVLAAGAGGFEAGGYISRNYIEGTELSDKIGRAVAVALAAFGSDEARDALDRRNRTPDIAGTLRIQIDSLGRPQVLDARADGLNLDVDLRRGPLLPGGVQ